MRYFLIISLAVLLGCTNKEETPAPVSKNGNLHIEYTGSYSSPIKSKLYLNGSNGTVWTLNIGPSTSLSHTKDTVFQGGQAMQFGAQSTYADGSPLVYGTFHIKIVFNGVTYCDDNINNNTSGVSRNATLPFIP